MKLFVFISFVLFVNKSANAQGSYKAAVVEYAPRLTAPTPSELLIENVEEYIRSIELAKSRGAEIIVFPEDGLTGWTRIDNTTIYALSTEVPDPTQLITPCTEGTYSKFFVDLSCAAKTHEIYTVINLIEKEPTKAGVYYNTNVVFARNGSVIARFRKQNLFNERLFTSGNEIVTFKTDFGVTFGMFICFDIMFKTPSLDLLNVSIVTDVVYSAAWLSQLPFLEAITVQHGYAISNGVNLLAAGLNDPQKMNGGSGIYLANGTIADSYISGLRGNKLVIADVPKISKRNTDSCRESRGKNEKGPGMGGIYPIANFVTFTENTVNYTFKELNFTSNNIAETICSGKFCCSFDISVRKEPNVQPNYIYKLLAFYGVSPVANLTWGLRNCGLVACTNKNNHSCGERLKEPPTGIIFEKISVKGSYDTRRTHSQPSTLRHDLQPVSGYSFCTKTSKTEVEITMTTTEPQKMLLTFGIHGRVYYNDYKPPGPYNNANILTTNVVVLLIGSILFFLQD